MARKKKIKNSELLLDDEALHELEVELLMHESNTSNHESDEDESHYEEDFDDDEEDEDFDDDDEDDEEEVAPPKKKVKGDKSKYYIIPTEFHAEILKYYENGIISDELAQMIEKIANKLSFSPNFINYSYKDDFIGDAIIKMFKALIGKKYTSDKGSNPFSYFTRIAFNAFVCRIKKENHAQKILNKYKEDLLQFSDNINVLVKNRNTRITTN